MYIKRIKLNVLNRNCEIDVFGGSVGCGSDPEGEEFFADEVRLVNITGCQDMKVYEEIDQELLDNFKEYEEDIREKIN